MIKWTAATLLAIGIPVVARAADGDASSGPELSPAGMSPQSAVRFSSIEDRGGPQSIVEADVLSEMHAADAASAVPLPTEADFSHRVADAGRSLSMITETHLPRSEQLERVAQEADRHTRHAYDLAGKNAFFAARSEFLAALRLEAEGLDAEHRTDHHSRALAAAMTAMKEAEDFLPRGSQLDASLDLSRILETHSTPVLKNSVEGVTPLAAVKCYMTFAQEQFAAAAGREVAASVALHGLGKLHAATTGNKTVRILAAEPKAMVYYQAALLAYPENFMAANDFGVLLARCGNGAEARAMLEYSVAVCPHAAGWHNLSVVYRQLGQPASAAQAGRQAEIVRQAEIARRRGMRMPVQDTVQWLDPALFARTSTNTPNSPDAVQPSPAHVAAQPTTNSSTPGASRPTPTTPQPTANWWPWGSQNTRR